MIDECDDGNTDDGDGCSSTCYVEAGYKCTLVKKNYPMVCEPYLGPLIANYTLSRDDADLSLNID
jgi:cysteine-rich repeat protein